MITIALTFRDGIIGKVDVRFVLREIGVLQMSVHVDTGGGGAGSDGPQRSVETDHLSDGELTMT